MPRPNEAKYPPFALAGCFACQSAHVNACWTPPAKPTQLNPQSPQQLKRCRAKKKLGAVPGSRALKETLDNDTYTTLGTRPQQDRFAPHIAAMADRQPPGARPVVYVPSLSDRYAVAPGGDAMSALPRREDALAGRQLTLLAIRSRELADRVAAGQLGFLDAVDFAYSAADRAGLIDEVGDDVVQAVLAAAFANAEGPSE